MVSTLIDIVSGEGKTFSLFDDLLLLFLDKLGRELRRTEDDVGAAGVDGPGGGLNLSLNLFLLCIWSWLLRPFLDVNFPSHSPQLKSLGGLGTTGSTAWLLLSGSAMGLHLCLAGFAPISLWQ